MAHSLFQLTSDQQALQEDLQVVHEAGKGHINVTVGSALDIFGGTLQYSEVLGWHRKQHLSHT